MSLSQLKELLELPAGPLSLPRTVVKDCLVLSCGCLVSEAYANLLLHAGQLTCPVCYKDNQWVVGPVEPLRALYRLIEVREGGRARSQPEVPTTTLMQLFYDIAKAENGTEPLDATEGEETVVVEASKSNIDDWQAAMTLGVGVAPAARCVSTATSRLSLSAQSAESEPLPRSAEETAGKSRELTETARLAALGIANRDEGQEYNFAKCFPMYRKQYLYSTRQKFFRSRGQLFIATAISPDVSQFVLLGESSWEVYRVGADPSQPPLLVCCGQSTGEYGPAWGSLREAPEADQIGPWEHLYCALSNRYLAIGGSRGVIRVLDLNRGGLLVYTHRSRFPIRCVDLAADDTYVACGITGQERLSGAEQTLIVLHLLSQAVPAPEPLTITLPYRDPINSLSFSADLKYLACSTVLESRFMVISVATPTPRLILKSLRALDTSLESEGITNIQFFPDNKLMAVSSVAFNAPPIVIRTKIDNVTGVHEIAQPVMVMRVDEVGLAIHRVAVSPRGDALAFLDRNGVVYVMLAPDMHHETRRVVVATEVANAYRMRESASLRFSKNGHQLYVVDRRGVLHIQDFAAGLPLASGMFKCKVLN